MTARDERSQDHPNSAPRWTERTGKRSDGPPEHGPDEPRGGTQARRTRARSSVLGPRLSASPPLRRRVENAVTLRALDVLAHRSHESLGGTVMGEERFPGAGAQNFLAEKEAPVVGPHLELRRPSKCLHGMCVPAQPAQQGTSQEVRLRIERTHADQAIDRGEALRRSPASCERLNEASVSLEAAGLKARGLAVIHAGLQPAAGPCESVTAGEMRARTVGEYTQGIGIRPRRTTWAA